MGGGMGGGMGEGMGGGMGGGKMGGGGEEEGGGGDGGGGRGGRDGGYSHESWRIRMNHGTFTWGGFTLLQHKLVHDYLALVASILIAPQLHKTHAETVQNNTKDGEEVQTTCEDEDLPAVLVRDDGADDADHQREAGRRLQEGIEAGRTMGEE